MLRGDGFPSSGAGCAVSGCGELKHQRCASAGLDTCVAVVVAGNHTRRSLKQQTFLLSFPPPRHLPQHHPTSPPHRPPILTPPPPPHTLLNPIPNPLHNLPIPPPPRDPQLRIPLLHPHGRNPPPPPPHRRRHLLPPPPYINAQRIPKQLGRMLPLVALELPGLPRGKDGDDAGPVVGFELLGGVDDDEAEGAGGVDGGE